MAMDRQLIVSTEMRENMPWLEWLSGLSAGL